MDQYFFPIFALTIALTRIALYIRPTASPTIGSFRLHHYMYGIVAAALGLASGSVVLYAIGLGLFVDELAYLLIRGKGHRDNYSPASLFGTLAFALLVFFLQRYLLLPFGA